MDTTDPILSGQPVDEQVLGEVVAWVLHAARLANIAAGQDLRSPWLDVLAEAVSAAGHLSRHPASLAVSDSMDPRGDDAGVAARTALTRAAAALDEDVAHRGRDVVLARTALTDAIALAEAAIR